MEGAYKRVAILISSEECSKIGRGKGEINYFFYVKNLGYYKINWSLRSRIFMLLPLSFSTH
jgi:hypothetical protein